MGFLSAINDPTKFPEMLNRYSAARYIRLWFQSASVSLEEMISTEARSVFMQGIPPNLQLTQPRIKAHVVPPFHPPSLSFHNCSN